jgi:hypothetical protein
MSDGRGSGIDDRDVFAELIDREPIFHRPEHADL